MEKLQGTIESVTPILKIPGLNEVRLMDDDRKFTIWDGKDKKTGKVYWLATTMQPGDSYEFDYEEKPNTKNPRFPYHNLSHPNNITGASVASPAEAPATPPELQRTPSFCPHCGKGIVVEFYKG